MTWLALYRPWLWCGVFLVIGWSLIFVITTHSWPHVNGIPESGRDHAEFADEFRIVALGDSLLERSLPRPGQFNTMLSGNIYWLHITLGGRDWREFEPLLAAISDFYPQVILLEDQLLMTRPPGEGIAWLRKARKSLNYFVWTHLGREMRPPEERAPFNYVAGDRQERLNHLSRMFLDNVPLDPEAVNFLTQLKQAGSRVMVFRLPKSAELEALEGREAWEEMLTATLGQMDIGFVTIGESLEEDQYYESAHTNERGMAVRSRQFRDLVNTLQP